MVTQIRSSGRSSVVLSVTIDEGAPLDIRAASKDQPDALRTELIKALRLVTLSPSDLALIQLQEKFRASFERPRLKTPDRLATVVYSCKQGTMHEALWEAHVWHFGGDQIVHAVSSVINSVSLDGKPSSDITRTLRLLEVGGHSAVTAFHLMNCPASLEDFAKAKEKFFIYGGIFALAACAVAISDDTKVMAILERLPLSHLRDLIAHMQFIRPHSDLAGIIHGVFVSKERSRTKRCRIGPCPRKSKSREKRQADTLVDPNQPRRGRATNSSTQHTTDEMAYRHISAQPSPIAICETPNEPAAAGHASVPYPYTPEGIDSDHIFGIRAGLVDNCANNGDLGVDLDTMDTMDTLLGTSDSFQYHGIDLEDLDLSTPFL